MQPSSLASLMLEVISGNSAGESASAFLAELIDCYLEETPNSYKQ